jgi:hypothetical protein
MQVVEVANVRAALNFAVSHAAASERDQ